MNKQLKITLFHRDIYSWKKQGSIATDDFVEAQFAKLVASKDFKPKEQGM